MAKFDWNDSIISYVIVMLSSFFVKTSVMPANIWTITFSLALIQGSYASCNISNEFLRTFVSHNKLFHIVHDQCIVPSYISFSYYIIITIDFSIAKIEIREVNIFVEIKYIKKMTFRSIIQTLYHQFSIEMKPED